MIPKIIHQTITDKQNLHPLFRENIVNLKKLNPEWEHRLYDEKDRIEFIAKFYDEAYVNTYLLMYEIGGVYLDIKSTVNVPLNSILNDEDIYLLSHWQNSPGQKYENWGIYPQYGVTNEFQTWHIIAAPKHHYLKEVIKKVKLNIDNYDPMLDGVGRIGVLKLSGPIVYSKVIQDIGDQQDHRLIDSATLGFEYSVTAQKGIKHVQITGSNYQIRKDPIIKVSFFRGFIFPVQRLIQKIKH